MLIITLIAILIFSQRFTISRWVQKLGALIARESVPDKHKPAVVTPAKTGTKPTTKKTSAKTSKKK